MAETLKVNPHRDAGGVALDAIGSFTGLKSLFKYAILYGVFSAVDIVGYPISDESIGNGLETMLGWSNLDYPLTVFATHVNDIPPERALAEGVSVFVAGLVIRNVGKRMKCV